MYTVTVTISDKTEKLLFMDRWWGTCVKTYGFIWGCLCSIITLMGIIHLSHILEAAGEDGSEKKLAETGIYLEVLTETAEECPEAFIKKEIGNRWEIILDQEEKELLARIIMLEAGGESDLGQQAVVEVILNRIHSPLFPDTVHEVLSQEGNGIVQFTSWKNRNLNAAEPTQQVIDSINAVLEGKTNILPYETLYFSVEGENYKVETVIGNHVFCN